MTETRERIGMGNGPRLLAALPCEDAALSAAMADGRISVQRIFYDVYAMEFPAAFDHMNVATVWMGGQGDVDYPVGVRLSGPDGSVIVEAQAVYVGAPLPRTAVIVSHLSTDGLSLVLPSPGRYSVDVLLDGVPEATFPVYVLMPPAPQPVAEEGSDGQG
jgi:hypothetical protein